MSAKSYPIYYDLNDVVIKQHVLEKWNTTCLTSLETLKNKNPHLVPSQIPDEQFRELKTLFGNVVGEVFVKVGTQELKMRVPKNDYLITKK